MMFESESRERRRRRRRRRRGKRVTIVDEEPNERVPCKEESAEESAEERVGKKAIHFLHAVHAEL
jgi:hypothetical protein